jgi:hypothetical protein
MSLTPKDKNSVECDATIDDNEYEGDPYFPSVTPYVDNR